MCYYGRYYGRYYGSLCFNRVLKDGYYISGAVAFQEQWCRRHLQTLLWLLRFQGACSATLCTSKTRSYVHTCNAGVQRKGAACQRSTRLCCTTQWQLHRLWPSSALDCENDCYCAIGTVTCMD